MIVLFSSMKISFGLSGKIRWVLLQNAQIRYYQMNSFHTQNFLASRTLMLYSSKKTHMEKFLCDRLLKDYNLLARSNFICQIFYICQCNFLDGNHSSGELKGLCYWAIKKVERIEDFWRRSNNGLKCITISTASTVRLCQMLI